MIGDRFLPQREGAILVVIVAVLFTSILPSLLHLFYPRIMVTEKIEDCFERFWEWRLRDSPEFGTFIGYHKYDHLLDTYSLQSFKERKKTAQSFLEEARNLLQSSDDLSPEAKQNLKLFIFDLTFFVEGLKSQGYLFPINRMEGVHIDTARLVNAMVYETQEDYEKLISRLRHIPVQIDEIISLLKEGIKLKMTNHEVSMKHVLSRFDQLETDVEDSPFYKPILTMPDSIVASVKEEIANDVKKIIKEDFFPAFRKLRKFLEEEYFSHLRREIGVSSLPNGRSFYEMCLKFHLGFDMTPEEIHRTGLTEVERIGVKMRKIIKNLGFDMSIKDFAEKLMSKDNFFTNETEVLDAYNDIFVNKIRPKLPEVVKSFPKSKLVIEAAPPSMSSGPGAYYLGGTATGKPGVFYVNTYRLDANPKHTMMTLALHESEPGHHLQWSFAIEQENIPEFRMYIEDRKYSFAPSRFPFHTAYIEGWGLYSEYLGYELGLYEDPYIEFGHLSYEMFRACRLVVDTGIHALGWDREKAIEYMVENTAMHRVELENEVDRYVTWPGQACAYKIGELKIKELREKAAKSLGAEFDMRSFHDIVLKSAGPLSLLEENMEKFINGST